MNCFVTDMREKEVINLKDGCRLGSVCDVEFDTCNGNIVSLVIFGKGKMFGLMGRCDDIKICWDNIKVIGDDTILVDIELPKTCKTPKKENILSGLFNS
ncbi:MAG: YlmC/YmxH family sporulation protein [Clostridia bacterium]|nr:YlmC/YmxH family sporulation protein [Clostridia bacterium]